MGATTKTSIMSYLIKGMEEVFTDQFAEYVVKTSQNEGIDETLLNLIMTRVAEYEEKNAVRFINFFGSDYIIFKVLTA